MKLLTALANPQMYEKLKQNECIEIIANDIQYQEGIFEMIEEQKEKIECILISELLPGKLTIEELVEKVRNQSNTFKIIVILQKIDTMREERIKQNEEIEVIYHNQITIEELVELIENNKTKRELTKEIIKLKSLLEKQEKEKTEDNKEIVYKEQLRIEEEIEKEYIIQKGRKKGRKKEKTNGVIVMVTGRGGVGKSTFIVQIAKAIQEIKKDILILDFDLLNHSISYMFSKAKAENIGEITLFKVDKNISILKGEQIKQNQKIIGKENSIEKLKMKYDIILIDTAVECYLQTVQNLANKSDTILFISEANIPELRKTRKLLEIYEKQWNISKEKINIVFNRMKQDSIDSGILLEVFKGIEVLGEVGEIKNNNIMANQHMKKIFLEKEVQNQYKKIAKKLVRNQKLNKYYLNQIERKD